MELTNQLMFRENRSEEQYVRERKDSINRSGMCRTSENSKKCSNRGQRGQYSGVSDFTLFPESDRLRGE
jgi:hypothetical protein